MNKPLESKLVLTLIKNLAVRKKVVASADVMFVFEALEQSEQEREKWRELTDKSISERQADIEALIEARCQILELEGRYSSIKPVMKPHKFRECVNGLLETAIAYAGTQQLRARLADRLSNFVEPDHPHKKATVKGGE